MSQDFYCSKCGEDNPNEFAPSAVNNFRERKNKGLKTWRPYCRACATEYQREYNQRPEVKARKKKAANKKRKANERKQALKNTDCPSKDLGLVAENPSVLNKRELAELMRCFVDLSQANARVQQVESQRINETLERMERQIRELSEQVSHTHGLLTKHSERIRRIDRATRIEVSDDGDVGC